MISSDFSQFGTQNNDDIGGTYYNTYSTLDYLNPFSVGYVSQDIMPRHLKPSKIVTRYSPTYEAEVIAEELLPDVYYDVMYLARYSANSFSPNLFNDIALIDNGESNYFVGSHNSGAQYGIWGKLAPLNALKPSLLHFVVSFTGIINGTSSEKSDVYSNNFSVATFKALIDKNQTVTFVHSGKTIDVIGDFESTGYLWRDDESVTGFYWIRYQFTGYGRNMRSDNTVGNYSLSIPAIGCASIDLVMPDNLTSLRNARWCIIGHTGTPFHGTGNRQGWGYGLRVRPITYNDLSGLRWEINEADTDNNLTLNYYYPSTSLGSSSQMVESCGVNLSGFVGKWPLVWSSSNVMSYPYNSSELKYYHEHMTDDQCSLFVSEGVSNFANFVVLPRPIDIWHHMALCPVWAMPGKEYDIAGFNSEYWYAEMDGNEFKGTLIPGDDPTLYDRVPPWILFNDTTINQYNPEEDKPEPGPTPDDGGEDDTRKRNDATNLPSFNGIRLVSGTGFSTFYNLSAYHVAALGLYLSQVNSSFWEALGTATDYKMSNLMDYICGFKWYPLNLQSSAPGLYPDVTTNSIQFGFNGAASIQLEGAGTSYKLGTVNRIFDFGTIFIP